MSDASFGQGADKNCPLPIKKLHHYSPMEVAEELSLMDAELLRKISPKELENGSWTKKDKKHQLSPNIMVMVRMFNQIALLVPTNILEEKTPQSRARVITSYIRIAKKCYTCHNYNSLKAILAGLQCTPIFRLNKTWKEVSSKRKRTFKHLTTLMSEEENWSAYRKELDPKIDSTSPFIPFLGVFLTDVALSQEAFSLAKRTRMKRSTYSEKGQGLNAKRSSNNLYETYTILEPITIRNRLEKLRNSSREKESGDDLPRSSYTHSDSDMEETDTESVCSGNKSLDVSLSPSKSLSSLSPLKRKVFPTKLLLSTPHLSSSPVPSDSVVVWNVDEWLKKIGLEKYSESFLDNGYETVELCANLCGKDLDAIGINNKQDRGSLVIHARKLLESDLSSLPDNFKQTATTLSNTNVMLDSDIKEPVEVSSVTRTSKGFSRRKFSGSLEYLIDAVKPGGGSFSETYERPYIRIKAASLHSIDYQDVSSASDVDAFSHVDSESDCGTSPDLTSVPKGTMSNTAGRLDRGVEETQQDSPFLPPQLPLHSTPFNSIEPNSRMEHKKSVFTSKIRKWLHLGQHMSHPHIAQRNSNPEKSHNLSVLCRHRKTSATVTKLRVSQMERSRDPINLLPLYQWLSFGCCDFVETNLQLRQLVTDSQYNTETQNYKLSYLCETE